LASSLARIVIPSEPLSPAAVHASLSRARAGGRHAIRSAATMDAGRADACATRRRHARKSRKRPLLCSALLCSALRASTLLCWETEGARVCMRGDIAAKWPQHTTYHTDARYNVRYDTAGGRPRGGLELALPAPRQIRRTSGRRGPALQRASPSTLPPTRDRSPPRLLPPRRRARSRSRSRSHTSAHRPPQPLPTRGAWRSVGDWIARTRSVRAGLQACMAGCAALHCMGRECGACAGRA
jgi:hypothetical protein